MYPGIQSTKFLFPVINYDNNYINMYQIEDLINSNLKNYNSVCYKYGYKNDKIINDDKKYYVTILNVQCPYFIFIGFEFSLPE